MSKKKKAVKKIKPDKIEIKEVSIVKNPPDENCTIKIEEPKSKMRSERVVENKLKELKKQKNNSLLTHLKRRFIPHKIDTLEWVLGNKEVLE